MRTLGQFFLIFILSTLSCFADIKKAGEAFRNGDYDTAFAEAEKAALSGDPAGAHLLGSYYLNNKLGRVDSKEAIKWLLVAAEANHVESQVLLGGLLLKGPAREGKEDEAKLVAMQWFERAASNGHHGAAYQVGVAYLSGTIFEKNVEQGIKYLTISADSNIDDHPEDKIIPQAQFVLGGLYFMGEEGFEPDFAKGLDYMLKSASNGNANAVAFLQKVTANSNN